jgi:imidazolonepropionase
MFDTVFTNLHAATMRDSADFGIINNAAIGVTDGKITYIGPDAGIATQDNVIDLDGAWVTPALIDCHTHLVYAGSRADEFERRLQGESYADIAASGGGILSTVRATRAASDDALYEQMTARFTHLFREGVFGIEIKSGYGLDLASEGKMLRAATRLRDELGVPVQRTFLGAHAVPPEFNGNADAYVDYICDIMLPALAAENLIDAVDAFCEKIAFSAQQVEKIFTAAQKLSLPVKLHAEQLSDCGGTETAARFCALSSDHLEYTNETAIKAMAEAQMTAVLLPGAFYYLREKQLPPVDLFRRHGVPMAIATDHNPGTSPILSPLAILNMACTLFRLTPVEAIAGMTRNAAKALGWQKRMGTIDTGMDAHLAVWNISHPRDLCYTLGGRPCRAMITGGLYNPFE